MCGGTGGAAANRLVTEPSSKTSRIARAISGAIDSTVILSSSFSPGVGSVLVTMTSLTLEFFSRSRPGRTARVRRRSR
jgi:hypothetical protein